MPALADGVEHCRLIQAERELLEGTGRGSVTRDGGHSEEIMRALDRVAVASGGYLEKSLAVQDLVSGLILAADLYATDGRLLLTEGTELSLAARTRINQYADHVGIREPIQIRVPL